jgi:DNA modification methylase
MEMIINADALAGLKNLADESVDMCVTSPPYYGLRDYGTGKWKGGKPDCDHKGELLRTRAFININTGTGIDVKNAENKAPYKRVCAKCGAVRDDMQIGLEETPEEYINRLVLVFREVKRVLKNDGTLWLNIADSYAGSRKGGATHPENAGNYKQGTNRGLIGQKETTFVSWGECKPKELLGIPWLLAFALRADGWYLRQDIIWYKPNCMPESVRDRCTKSHEYLFLLSKSRYYYFDNEAIKEPCVNGDPNPPRGSMGTTSLNQGRRLKGNSKSFRGGGAYTNNRSFNNSADIKRESHGNKPNPRLLRNKRSVWAVASYPYKEAHFATFPPDLIRPCILAGSRPSGIVLDPFFGSGTTGLVASEHGRGYIGIELNTDYVLMAEKRLECIQRRII